MVGLSAVLTAWGVAEAIAVGGATVLIVGFLDFVDGVGVDPLTCMECVVASLERSFEVGKYSKLMMHVFSLDLPPLLLFLRVSVLVSDFLGVTDSEPWMELGRDTLVWASL